MSSKTKYFKPSQTTNTSTEGNNRLGEVGFEVRRVNADNLAYNGDGVIAEEFPQEPRFHDSKLSESCNQWP